MSAFGVTADITQRSFVTRISSGDDFNSGPKNSLFSRQDSLFRQNNSLFR